LDAARSSTETVSDLFDLIEDERDVIQASLDVF